VTVPDRSTQQRHLTCACEIFELFLLMTIFAAHNRRPGSGASLK
jgi:hypothetical protein